MACTPARAPARRRPRGDRGRALAEVLRRITEVVPVRAAAILTGEEGRQPAVTARGGAEAPPDFSDGPARAAVQFVLAQGKPVAWGGDRRHWEKALASQS